MTPDTSKPGPDTGPSPLAPLHPMTHPGWPGWAPKVAWPAHSSHCSEQHHCRSSRDCINIHNSPPGSAASHTCRRWRIPRSSHCPIDPTIAGDPPLSIILGSKSVLRSYLPRDGASVNMLIMAAQNDARIMLHCAMRILHGMVHW